ncbi:hypothetical protein [Enterococcus avium]|uniref:hypothetical protein n=1 Tax=Enterococcus avium TaxID=33945 RepID=UPI001F575C8B|nr:hypothetical protein [Enterococcus avium]
MPKWCNEQCIPFQERLITQDNPLTAGELKAILKMTKNGFEEIISCRSLTCKQLVMDIPNYKTMELIQKILRENTHAELSQLSSLIVVLNKK